MKKDAIEILNTHAILGDMPFLQTDSTEKDLFKTLLGERLGLGSSRAVFRCRLNPKLVIKVEQLESHQNVIEWHTWQELSDDKKASRWFAPCYDLSPNGRVLVMAYAEPAQKKDFPKRIPTYLNDRKYTNFGILDGRLVCFDYGNSVVTEPLSSKTKKAAGGKKPDVFLLRA